jgi:pyruvate formate lyase activating enzyme
MDVFIHKFVSVSPLKVSGNVCSELHLAGTNIAIPFLNEEENSSLESKFAVNIKEIKAEIDSVKKTSRTIIIKNGEPCLQGLALKSLASYIKSQGFMLGIETYGTRPSVIKHLLDHKLVDLIILKSYFPLEDLWMRKINKGKLVANNQEIIDEINKTITMLKTSNVKVIAKTIIVPNLLDKKPEIAKIAKEVRDLRNCVLELISFDPRKGSKLMRETRKPDDELLHQLKQHINERYPSVTVRISY